MDELEDSYQNALELEKSGHIGEAIELWQRVLELDPEDHGGAAIRLAALGAAPSPQKAPVAYVETLFDQHAEDFDDILVDQLSYAVPLQLNEMLLKHAPGPYNRALDLGCGTGLTGSALGAIVKDFTGVDIAQNMIEQADERDVYDGLYVGEVEDFIVNIDDEDNWDLITATDVMPYIGALEVIFEHCAKRLNSKGYFAFSTERLDEPHPSETSYCVGPHHRYAHEVSYIEALAQEFDFVIIANDRITVRMEEDLPVAGNLFLLQKEN